MREKGIAYKEKKLGTVEQEFFKEIEKTPLKTQEEIEQLIKEYHEGNLFAKDVILQSNLRLIVFNAKKFIHRVHHMSFMDLIQEGAIGLLRSIETYDPKKSAFSTYATEYIVRHIDRAVAKEEKAIRIPENKISDQRKYSKLIEAEKNLTDKELCERLEITTPTLDFLKNNKTTNVISLSTKKYEEEKSLTLEDFLEDPNAQASYETIINREADQFLFSFLNNTLSSLEFLILYYRILIPTPVTLEKIGDELGLTKESIRKKEEKLKRKLALYSKDNPKKYAEMLKDIDLLSLKKIRTTPLTPRDITKYLYLRPFLNDIEYKIYYYLYISKETLSIKEITKQLKISAEEMKNYLDNINRIIKELDKSDYEEYHKDLIKIHKSSIYDFVRKKERQPLAYNYLRKKYDYTLEEFLILYQKEWEESSEKEKNLLEKYFKGLPNGTIQKNYANRFLNVLLYGYRKKDTRLPLSKLKEAYLKKKHEFKEIEQLIIENIILGSMSKKEFNRINKTSIDAENINGIIFRLEKIYYDIDKYKNNSFDKEKYLEVKRRYPNKITDNQEQLLDLYYGVNETSYSIEEIANLLHISYTKAVSTINSACKSIMNLYANKSCALNIDKNIYIPYINNPRYPFAQNLTEILILYFLEDKTYEEIEQITNLSAYEVSNRITAAIRRIDFIRYNITPTFYPEKEVLEEVMATSSLTEVEKKIIEGTYIQNLDIDEIAKQTTISKENAKKIIAKFNKLYRNYLIKDVVLEKSDIEKELSKQRSESILTAMEKQFISYLYGIKNQYNKEGEKLNKKEISTRLNLPPPYTFNNIKNSIEKKLKHNKIGTYTDTICYIKRKDLEEYLKDVHLPISEKERVIICHLFEINNYSYKSMEEIAALYNETEKNIYNRYLRAILSILKYKNKEIPGTINYEYDIMPNLKYFPKNERLYLEEYYHNGLTYKEIANKYKINYNKVHYKMNKINIKVFEIIENKKCPLFDFDYLEEHWQDKTFPFDGDKALAKEIFDLYFGNSGLEELEIPEIICKLNINSTPSKISNMIGRFMLASKKHQDKIYKEKSFTFEEIVDYYNSTKNDMPESKKKIYESYIKSASKAQFVTVNRIPTEILYDLIRIKYKGGTDIFTLNKEAIKELLIRFKRQIVPGVKNTLMLAFRISYRELLSGQELSTVYKILDRIDRKENQKEESQKLTLSAN